MEEQKFNFEVKIDRIQDIVDVLDKGEATIEELVTAYEEGMKLANECREFLQKTENKIIDITNEYTPSEIIADAEEIEE